jgi:hypothetical protein
MPIAIDTKTTAIAGLPNLWAETLGEPQICVAILDGWVDRSHPSLAESKLTQLEPLVLSVSPQASVSQHGTQVTSIILGQHRSSLRGVG